MQMSKQVSIYKHDIAVQDTFATKRTIAVCRNHSLLFSISLAGIQTNNIQCRWRIGQWNFGLKGIGIFDDLHSARPEVA